MRAHGINGAMVVRHFCDSYEVFESLESVYLKNENGYTKLKIKSCAPYKTNLLLAVDKIKTPEEVTQIRLNYLYAKREDILKDEDDYFIVDLIGLPIIDAVTGEQYGILDDVVNQGAQDLYKVKREGKGDSYIPVVEEFVKEIDPEKAIYITPIEGMID
jgi:16S rRNA processing protein RimM